MAKNVVDLLSLNNEVFRSYLFWSAVLVLKMLIMSILTGLQRFRTKSFINPEDCVFKNDDKVVFNNPHVERVRRAHRNDMENILPFFIAGLMYVLINPSASLAINLFRAVAVARIVHTFVYAIVVIPQPARGLCFFVAFFATAYMAIQVILYAL